MTDSQILTVLIAACVVLLLVILVTAAAKGFTIAELWRLSLGAHRRFWSGERDWSRHGNEDAKGRRP